MKKIIIMVLSTCMLLFSCALSPGNFNAAIENKTLKQKESIIITSTVDSTELLTKDENTITDEEALNIMMKYYEPARLALYEFYLPHESGINLEKELIEIDKNFFSPKHKTAHYLGLYFGDYEWMQAYLYEFFTPEYIKKTFSYEYPNPTILIGETIYVFETTGGNLFIKALYQAEITKKTADELWFYIPCLHPDMEYKGESYIKLKKIDGKWLVFDFADPVIMPGFSTVNIDEVKEKTKDTRDYLFSIGMVEDSIAFAKPTKKLSELAPPRFEEAIMYPLYTEHIEGTPDMSYMKDKKLDVLIPTFELEWKTSASAATK